jgi:carbon-monoxide dehydrogenase large subunit
MTRRDTYIGTPVERIEDLRFLRGRGQYIDDLKRDGLLHAAIVRSAFAHGRIRAIDTAAALAMPGVRAVITAADLGKHLPTIAVRSESQPSLDRVVQPVIARDKVRYVGEPLAVVIAASAALAEDAANVVGVEIDALPAVTDHRCLEDGATLLFDECGSNQAATLSAVRGDAARAFAEADYRRCETFKVHRHAAIPMETRGLLAEWNAARGRLTLSGAAKVPFFVRAALAKMLDLPEHAVDAVETDIGGGFGARGEFFPEDFLIPFAARLLNCPVKWVEDRREHLMATTHAREVDCELEIACRRDGTILGLRGRAWTNIGAYARPNAVTPSRNMAQMLPGPYRVPHVQMDITLYLSNKTPVGTYRAPGRFETDFCRERLIDIAAAELGIDRVEMRRRNLVTAAEIPYALPQVLPYGGGGEFDSGDYRVTLDRCLAEIGWQEKSPLEGKLVDGVYHGLGVGCYVEGGSTGPRENARMALDADGMLTVTVGASAVGQGLETVFAQIAADALEIPIDHIAAVHHGSTTGIHEGFGSFGSRASVMGGSAILICAENLKKIICEAAAQQLGCAAAEVVIVDGLRAVTAGARRLTLAELSPAGFVAAGTFSNSKRTYSYGAHAAHVTVDPRTGQVTVLDYVAVEDVGRILNPHTLHGQTIGAIAQGLGGTLLEGMIYDDEGQLLTGSLAAYLIPCAVDFPNLRAIALEQYPSPLNPLGAKGAGEGGIIPVGGVIANAVASALRSFGVKTNELPLSQPRVWQLIENARKAQRT